MSFSWANGVRVKYLNNLKNDRIALYGAQFVHSLIEHDLLGQCFRIYIVVHVDQ